jgi:hypothetical protein
MENTNFTNLQSITGGPMKPHEYVLVKRKLKAVDARYIQNHSTKARKSGENPEDIEIVMTLGDSQFATLCRAIRGWNLTQTIEIDGQLREQPIPFIPEQLEQCIEELDEDLYTYLLEQVKKLYESKAGGESPKPFRTAVIDSSETNLDAERVLRLRP